MYDVPWPEGYLKYSPEQSVEALHRINQLPAPRFFKSHARLEDIPRPASDNCRYVYCARNPKDVAVSYYFHIRSKQHEPRYTAEFSDYLVEFEAGRVPCGDHLKHVLDWWKSSKVQSRHQCLYLH